MTGKGQPQRDRREHRRLTVAAVTLAVNLGSFAYLVLVARSASPAVFGALAALAGITLLFEVPANALQVAVGRALAAAARPAGRPASPPGRCWYRPVRGGSALCLVLLALSPLVERFLHLPSITSALLLGRLRPPGRRQRRAQRRPRGPGSPASPGHRPHRRDRRADRARDPAGAPWRWARMAPSWPWSGARWLRRRSSCSA